MAVYISMPAKVTEWINTPLILLNIIVNIFYAFCLIFLPRRKQPLTALLGLLIFCILAYCALVTTLGYVDVLQQDFKLYSIVLMCLQHFTDYSMTTYVWINFYFYLKIVPSQSVLILWVKKNIKCTIYTILLANSLFQTSTRLLLQIFDMILWNNLNFYNNFNLTNFNQTNYEASYNQEFKLWPIICLFIVFAHFLLSLCVMLVSSLSTAYYLHRHIKNMAKSGRSFSSKRLRAQMRVTITGIFQGLLYFFYSGYYCFYSFVEIFLEVYLTDWIFVTVTTLFISGTTVTLGIGQTTFRQRIEHMYKTLKTWASVKINMKK